MNTRQLEAFHATIATGSATRAAERLGVSQPAVSKLLRNLSDSCGFELFARSGGRLVPTLEGRLIAAEVERMFSGTQRIAQLIEAVRNQEAGQVTIAAPAALATRYLATTLAPMMQIQNELRLTILSRTSPQIAELVAAQQIDIGLSLIPFDHPNVQASPIMRFSMVCVMPADHPLAHNAVVHVEELAGETFIALARDDCSLMTIDRAFQMTGVQKRSRIEVPMSETACAFVAAGAGVSILPPFVGLDYGEDRLVRRPLEPDTTMDLWMLTPNRSASSLAARRVADFLKTALAPFDAASR
ncbi:LysR substrate-binding domain-containing protein [Aureimonas sp. AU4]|uniref:LysR substrate-binding domain-containing protein n=1 Tax=Aureimonas sp. AU4 TaxID=1638163 RepID=UPI0007850DAE|nr:LysR substrate-binding domain-containing protein [Aureimonas sp. AU4]